MKTLGLADFFRKVSLLRESLHIEGMSQSQLNELQSHRLRKLLAHAYASVPYYRQLFDFAGLDVSTIRSIENLGKIPITTKTAIRSLPTFEVTSSRIDQPLVRSKTSGSSGVILNIFQTQHEVARRIAIIKRGNLAAGMRWNDRKLTIAGPRLIKPGFAQRFGFFPEHYVSAFADISFQMQEIRTYQPKVLGGFPSSLEAIANDDDAATAELSNLRLIICGGELLLQSARRTMEEKLHCKVINAYAAEEVGRIAIECPVSEGLHVNSDAVIVEIVRNGKVVPPGSEGQIVVTSLNSFAMPFIRYELDDIGMLEPTACPCGRAFPLVSGLKGRLDDQIRLANGSVQHPAAITTAILETPGIAGFQVIQKLENRFTVLLKPDPYFDHETLKALDIRLRARLGESEIEFQLVDKISREPSGKQRRVISKVRQ